MRLTRWARAEFIFNYLVSCTPLTLYNIIYIILKTLMICAQGKQYTFDEGHIRFVGEQFPGRRYNFNPTRNWLDRRKLPSYFHRTSQWLSYGIRIRDIYYTYYINYYMLYVYNVQRTARARNYRGDISYNNVCVKSGQRSFFILINYFTSASPNGFIIKCKYFLRWNFSE